MSDGQHGGTSDLFVDKLLDCPLCHYIYVCGGLIKYYNLVAAQDCTHDANELALSNREIFTFLLDLKVQDKSFKFTAIINPRVILCLFSIIFLIGLSLIEQDIQTSFFDQL